MTIRIDTFLKYTLLVSLVGITLTPIRSLGIYNSVHVVMILNLIMQCSIIFFVLSDLKSYHIEGIEFFLLFFPFILIPVSILNNNLIKEIISDLIKPILFIFTVVFFKNVNIDRIRKSKKIEKLVNLIFLVGSFVIILCIIIYLYVKKIYFSSSDLIYSFPIILFFLKEKYLLLMISLFLLLLSGKRGIVFSILLIFTLFYMKNFKYKKYFINFMIMCVIVIFISISVYFFGLWGYIPFFNKIFGYFVNNNVETGIMKMLGGRWEEVVLSTKPILNNPVFIITGMGPGYTYEYISSWGSAYNKYKHGVHFSPVNMLVTYGILYVIVLYYYLLKQIKKSIDILDVNYKRFDRVFILKSFSMFLMANFIFSFTVNSIFVVPLFAISIGILNNKYFSNCNDA